MATAEQLVFFRQQASEFNNLSDAYAEGMFTTALVHLDADLPRIPANKLDLAVALFAAHLAWLQKYPGQGGASRGPVTSEKDASRQKNYAVLANSDNWLGQSLYGQSFTELTGIFSRSRTRAAIMTRFGVINNTNL